MHRLRPLPARTADVQDALVGIARTGTLFVNGDALENVFASGRDWTSGDDINFAHEPFIELKRTVMAIERIGDFRYFACLALVRRDDPTKIESAVCGARNWMGVKPVDMTPSVRRCVQRDEVVGERARGVDAYDVAAPVKNSDGELAGLLLLRSAEPAPKTTHSGARRAKKAKASNKRGGRR
jgi:hypothetical protein